MCPCFQGHPKWFQFFQGQPMQHQQRVTGVSSKLIQCCLSFSRPRANQWVTVLKFNHFFSESSTSMLQMVLATFLKCCFFSQGHPKCYGFFPSSTNVAVCSGHFPEVLQCFPSSTNVAVVPSHFPEVLRFFSQVQPMLRFFLATSLKCCGFFSKFNQRCGFF